MDDSKYKINHKGIPIDEIDLPQGKINYLKSLGMHTIQQVYGAYKSLPESTPNREKILEAARKALPKGELKWLDKPVEDYSTGLILDNE